MCLLILGNLYDVRNHNFICSRSVGEGIHLKDIFVQFQKELYKCISLSEFIFQPLNIAAVWMFLSQSIPLGAKKGQRMMNSERDTHLCSCFFTCTNVSFRCISHSFNQNWIKFLQFIFEPLNIIAVLRCSYHSLWLWELKLPKD